MFGKVFDQMYDGTLATKGPWQALVTFQQLIVLADKYGVVDMTSEAISRRTTIPLEIIQIGLNALEQPDPESRSPAEQGCRIIRLADNRDWGWQLVNFEHYRNMRSADERRVYMRNLMREKRAKAVSQDVSTVSTVSPPLAMLAHAVSSKQYAVSSKHKNNGSKAPLILPDWLPIDQWESYLAMRKQIKRPASEQAKRMAIGKLEALKDEGHSPTAVLAQSIFNSWQGLFPLKDQR